MIIFNGLNIKTKKQMGFTLVEVLVTTLILSIGMLGILTMQARSLQYNHQAYLRSQAIFLIDSIIDKMRSNTGSISESEYLTHFTNSHASISNNCISSSCTSMQIADWDKKTWKSEIALALPEGKGAISNVGERTFNVRVRYTAQRAGNNPDQLDVTVQL
jgi:type IV pilus assembly protein PilV